jgi:urease accessory protein
LAAYKNIHYWRKPATNPIFADECSTTNTGCKQRWPFVFKESIFSAPFKVPNITEDKSALQFHLVLMSSLSGILDVDIYEMEIKVENSGSLQLFTHSYQRFLNMKQGATQQLNVQLADDSAFCFLPHPSVPHEQSIFTTHNNFYLSNYCQFVFGDEAGNEKTYFIKETASYLQQLKKDLSN